MAKVVSATHDGIASVTFEVCPTASASGDCTCEHAEDQAPVHPRHTFGAARPDAPDWRDKTDDDWLAQCALEAARLVAATSKPEPRPLSAGVGVAV